jgi:hypothetical protein
MDNASVSGLLAGTLIGIVPVIMGALKCKFGLGVGGFFACVASGLILGLLLAVPICGIFVWLITKKPKQLVATHKKCPYCSGEMLIEARVCKHCGRELD